MARTPPAPVAPSLLIWARESLGLSLDEAAQKQRIAPERLARWEAEEDVPTVAQLRKAAGVYRRPLAVFFLSEPPGDFHALRDFRRPRSNAQRGWSPELRLAVRRARDQQEAVGDLLDLLGGEPRQRPELEVGSLEAKPLAVTARRLLGVDVDTQFTWRDEYRALNGWILALEREVGALVLQAGGISPDEMRGFSIAHGGVPVIVLNATDAVRGRIFTAIHEFAHVLLNDAGLCDLQDRQRTRREEDRIERLCNEVAGAVLMPADSLLAEPALLADEEERPWTNAEISALADKYKVSREALVRRLVSLGRASSDFYWAKRREYQPGYGRGTLEREGFRVSFQRRRVRDYGRGYVRLVLEAYHRGRINTLDAADYLGGVNVRHLPSFEQEAYRTVAAT